jgi:hypothetical protein
MAAGDSALGSLAPRCSGKAPGHRGRDRGLVDEDEVLGVELLDPLAKDRPLLGNVGLVLLAGADRLF